MFEKKHDIEILNGLIETTVDSIDGYRRSAEEAPDSRFAAEFLDRAAERARVVVGLREEIRRLGGEPKDDGSLLAAAHRTFLTLRDTVAGGDDKAVIAEVDRGESYLNKTWEDALANEELSPEARKLIAQNYETVRAGHQRWQAVHHSMEERD
ncbi:PA2169 family four-helix-bundle protein [Sphingosinicella rhizophila]|uniref:PA2169 family four-helix-bundle protein n=1 Tax=Sphingosinicella rhizophila TaxID=3050082 RepID=A0ABU3QC59_9SPHN|nr:PA2169 family four-helix-bundle protein [Sphingosinicella sp. GR2756]MDT9601001.1 PA2169 family four-helix-bundle protein [Sphingosinicella sp. GR2756]